MIDPILDGYLSLGDDVNKVGGNKNDTETTQGVVSLKFPVLELKMDNKDIIDLTKKWKKAWEESTEKDKWEKQIKDNEKYWLGKQFDHPDAEHKRPLVDNVIFEGMEGYLPQIIQRNPDPMVELEDEELEEQFADFPKNLQKDLGKLADELKLRLKLKRTARQWFIYQLGVCKLGWDADRDIPTVKVIRPQRLILDPKCTVDEDGYTGEYIGEYRSMTADRMIQIMGNIDTEAEAVKYIKEKVKDDLGTVVQFIEWWTQEYICWTLDDKVLMKSKNPHWNYNTKQTGQSTVDEYGRETPGQEEEIEGENHFKTPKMPYLFLSMFNLGKQPMDDTGLIQQNLSNQDLVNTTLASIVKNVKSMNNGMVVSGERSGLTKEQATGVTEALRNGGTVFIPSGAVNEAVARMPAPGLPSDVYNHLQDIRARTRDIFGTRGLAPVGMQSNRTVRGMILNNQADEQRIGNGFAEVVEQLADDIYNWFTQLLFVYDDEYLQIKGKPEVCISIKEGSLLPKDPATLAQQAIDLAKVGKMSLIDLFKKMDFSNAKELAANVWLEGNAPELLFKDDPRVQQAIQMKQQAAQPEQKIPSESISFKDLPPEGQAQMAAQAGITLHPEALAAHAEHLSNQDLMKQNQLAQINQANTNEPQP